MIIAVGFPVALLLMRNRPADEGLVPDGGPPPEERPGTRAVTPTVDLTPRETLGSLAFWGIVFWFGLRMFVVASISIHFIRLIETKDFSARRRRCC